MPVATVRVSSELPVPAATVVALVVKPALLRHVCWPLLTFDGLPEDDFGVGGVVVARLRLAGVLPLWHHTVRLVEVDTTGLAARTEEHGGPLRRWTHRVGVVEVAPDRCRYTDEITLDAGLATSLAALGARAFYRHRHRRWAALARVLA